MKTAKEVYEVMKAFEEGKEIEIYQYFRWTPCKEPTWDWESNDYRIKPEKVEPKYRPYESVDEWVKDFDERFPSKRPEYSMPLIWMKDKTSGSVRLVDILSSLSDLKGYFRYYNYLDGTTVGKKVEG